MCLDDLVSGYLDLKTRNMKTVTYAKSSINDRRDMIEMFKILHDFYDINPHAMILVESTTRGHSNKLVKPFYRSTTQKHMFFNRIINNWNSPPGKVVNASPLNELKNLLCKHWIEKKCVHD